MLLSSHILAEVEALCERVSIIRIGRTVESGTLTELRHLTRHRSRSRPCSRRPESPSCPVSTTSASTTARARFDVETAQLDGVVRYLSGLGIRSMTSTPPTLEELFLRHYGDEIERLEGGDAEVEAAERAVSQSTLDRDRRRSSGSSCAATGCGCPVWVARHRAARAGDGGRA